MVPFTTKFLPLILATFLSVSSSVSASHSRSRTEHQSLSKRLAGDLSILDDLDSLFTDTRWTYFDAGLGACGEMNDDSDFIVALNSIQFGPGYPGPQCFKTITMEYNGKKATATIMDMCPECPYGALDLSRGLFQFFAPEDIGVIYGQWYFGDDLDDDHDHDDRPRGNKGKGHEHHTPPKPKPKPPPTTRPNVHSAPKAKPPSLPKPKPAGKQVPGSAHTHGPEATHLSRPLSHPVGAAPKKQEQQSTKNSKSPLQIHPSSTSYSNPPVQPNISTEKNKNVVGNGLSKLPTHMEAATSKAAPMLKGTPFQSEFDSESSKDSENLAALNKFLGRLGSITFAGSTTNRKE